MPKRKLEQTQEKDFLFVEDEDLMEVHTRFEIVERHEIKRMIEQIDGIDHATILGRYQVNLVKGRCFEWEEIIPNVESILNDKKNRSTKKVTL